MVAKDCHADELPMLFTVVRGVLAITDDLVDERISETFGGLDHVLLGEAKEGKKDEKDEKEQTNTTNTTNKTNKTDETDETDETGGDQEGGSVEDIGANVPAAAAAAQPAPSSQPVTSGGGVDGAGNGNDAAMVEAVAVAAAAEAAEWVCHLCSNANQPGEEVCSMCMSERDGEEEPPVAVPTGRGILFRAYERRKANKRWVLKAIHSVLSIMSTNDGVVEHAADLPLHDAEEDVHYIDWMARFAIEQSSSQYDAAECAKALSLFNTVESARYPGEVPGEERFAALKKRQEAMKPKETVLSNELERGIVYRVLERSFGGTAQKGGKDGGGGGKEAEKGKPSEMVWRCFNRHMSSIPIEVCLTFNPGAMEGVANHALPTGGMEVKVIVPPKGIVDVFTATKNDAGKEDWCNCPVLWSFKEIARAAKVYGPSLPTATMVGGGAGGAGGDVGGGGSVPVATLVDAGSGGSGSGGGGGGRGRPQVTFDAASPTEFTSTAMGAMGPGLIGPSQPDPFEVTNGEMGGGEVVPDPEKIAELMVREGGLLCDYEVIVIVSDYE
jgi:hypothetical protein